jgi:hypothetical protein
MLSLIYNNLPSFNQTFQRLKNILYIPKMDTDSSNPVKWYEPLILKAKDYDFNEPVSKSDKEFWQGVGAKIYDDDDEEIKRTLGPFKCILHVNTNLIITYEGKIIGRQTDDGIIYIEDLDPKIIQWYMNCGF